MASSDLRLRVSVAILVTAQQVEPYIDQVRIASDSNKRSLGFLPASVFAGHARRNQLFVAVEQGSGRYLGHLLFDLKTPNATVLQMYADPAFRRHGVASRLIDELKRLLTLHEFLAIRARVAEDLVDANRFWAREGFVVSKKVAGGETTGRKILVRICELDTPQLFPVSGLAQHGSDSLGLAPIELQTVPLYLVDLNILFDVAHQRANHDDAVALLRLAHLGEFRLAISDEAGRELDATASPGRPDSMRGPIEALPRAALHWCEATEKLIEELAALIFPEKAYPAGLKRNDFSDIRHVATAISHNAAGFVTRDDRIIRVADELRSIYGISVLSVVDFLQPVWSDGQKIQLDVAKINGRFELERYRDEDASAVRSFLQTQGLQSSEIVGAWVPITSAERLVRRVVAKVGDQIVGYCCCSRSDRDDQRVFIRMAADEALSFSVPLSIAMLTSITDECIQLGIRSLSLSIPAGQTASKEAAYGYGFRAEKDGVLRKLALNLIVTPETWQRTQTLLKQTEILQLPECLPEWRRFTEPQPIYGADGERRFLSFREIETLLSPALFAAEGRPSLVVPIRTRYLQRLLGSNRQLSFGPKMQAELSRERVYLGDPRTLSKYSKGSLLFFYESGSGGANAIVAVARVTDAFLIRRDAQAFESLSQSVLTAATLSEIGSAEDKAACLFDSALWLPRSVPVKDLRSIGIQNGQLITALKLSNEQTKSILSIGGVE
jgi:GNAT superfamily N-acetyltransferase